MNADTTIVWKDTAFLQLRFSLSRSVCVGACSYLFCFALVTGGVVLLLCFFDALEVEAISDPHKN